MKVEVAVLGSPSLVNLMVSVDAKATLKRKRVEPETLAVSGWCRITVVVLKTFKA